jgi:hypothetical protein
MGRHHPGAVDRQVRRLIGGMGIRTKRALKVNFTIPYDYSGMSMVASKKKAAGFDSLDDFNKPEVELAIKMGTTAVMAAKKFMPKAKLRLFEDQAQAYQELRNGNVHAVVGSAPRPALRRPNTRNAFYAHADNFTKEPIGFALRKGDFDTLGLLQRLDPDQTRPGLAPGKASLLVRNPRLGQTWWNRLTFFSRCAVTYSEPVGSIFNRYEPREFRS